MTAATSPDRSWWDLVPVWLFVGGMVLSYVTLLTFALAIGFDPLIAWIFPLLPDGFILYAAREASEAAAAGHRAARWWAWGMVVLWTGVSAGLQALDVVHLGTAAMAGHMVPPVVMLCAWEMRLRRAARDAGRDPAPVADPAAGPGAVHAQLRAEVRDQIAATLRAEVATELRSMVEGELGAVRAELHRTAGTPVPELPPPPTGGPPELGRSTGGLPELTASAPPSAPVEPSPQDAGGSTRAPTADLGVAMAERGRAYLAAHPGATAVQLQQTLGCSGGYARQLLRRHRQTLRSTGGSTGGEDEHRS